jgi:hypothetical protein
VIAREIRGCLRNPSSGQYSCKSYALPSATTLASLFATVGEGPGDASGGLLFSENDVGAEGWLAMLGRSRASTQANSFGTVQYLRSGVNLRDTLGGGTFYARVRFGALVNNEASISTTNDAIGMGGYSDCGGNALAQCTALGWAIASGHAANPARTLGAQGQIWVR